jgi:hypothetical protein
MNYWEVLPIRVPGRYCLSVFLGGSTYPSPFRSEYPLGEMRPWGMNHQRARAYAREASCRAGANQKPERREVAMDRRPLLASTAWSAICTRQP